MEYTHLGSSGLKISRIAMGTMSFGEGDSGREGWPIPYEDAVPFFRQALDLGITFWDTANGYNAGTSEEAVGRALKEFTRRDDIVVATKVFFPVHDGPGGSGLSRKAIMEQIDDSLTRLGTDYVDLYQIHRFDAHTPVEETMEALHDVVKAGKARYLGASSMQAWQFAKLQHAGERNGWTKFVSMQDQYTLINRGEELEMFGLLADQGCRQHPVEPARPGGRHSAMGRPDHEQGRQGHGPLRPSAVARHRPGRHRRHPTHRRNPWGVDGSGCAGVGAEEPGR